MIPFPLDSSPSLLWALRRDGKVASCEVHFVPTGSEVRMLRNGSLLMSRIFPTGEAALAWAEEERTRLMESGWTRPLNVPFGLCASCVHAKVIESSKRAVFVLCGLSLTDPRFPRYPRLPVLACHGYAPERRDRALT